MKITRKVRYGLRTMLEIAAIENNQGILQKEIAKNQGISVKFLDKIVSSLKNAGLLLPVSGKKSGYKLAIPADKITVYDIFKALDEDAEIIDCIKSCHLCSKNTDCKASIFWSRLENHLSDFLKTVSLQNILDDKNCFTDQKFPS
jgi:Rrf2 family protein